MNDLLIELQTKMEYQAEEIAHLSQELYIQQKELSQLKRQMAALMDRFRSLSDTGPQDNTIEPPPPHY